MLLFIGPAYAVPNSVAVLPFNQLDTRPEYAYLAAGIYASTLNQLTRISDLVVIARHSVMQCECESLSIPEIATALQVDMVMEGSVRYVNDRVLISAQLLDGRSGEHLWSGEFNSELGDVFSSQAEIARSITTAMGAQLLPDELTHIDRRPTESLRAYRHYLHALSLPVPLTVTEFLPAYIKLLESAIAADPTFAMAYADLAWGYYVRGDRATAAEFAQQALALEQTVASAYSMLGVSLELFDARQEEANAAYMHAVDLGPGDAEVLIEYASFLVERIGDDPNAIELGKRAVAIDPLNAVLHGRLGYIFLNAGELPLAAEQLREAITLDRSVYMNHFELASVEYRIGDHHAARESLDHAVQIMEMGATFRVGYLAYLYGLLGEVDKATTLLDAYEEILDDPEGENWRPKGWAILGSGDKQRALLEWSRTVDGYLRDGQPVSRGRISRFRDNWLNDPVLEQPEFLQLRKRLGFRQ